ncbi:leucyl aminopeptidase [Paenibacillus sp. UNCCL117]|uniref:leucyl aminopeptidase n=1 Tax=unclassified Paenibacillus TaxID=185978 RepID=UPI00088713CF|nr:MULTISPECIES: leucyl aminopeptidase [unclassified Paenibacillus]SDE23578.1 leucyl aminopeptidase [Paenibacillus sp. cl123]SFW42549.1 leucyl aminopeptidase [Paenibacillus sp. UNCCL117]
MDLLERYMTQELSLAVELAESEAGEAGAEALAFFMTPEELASGEWAKQAGAPLPPALVDAVRGLAARGRFAAGLGETEAVPTLGLMPGYQAILLCGLGEAARTRADAWRDAGVYAARAALGLRHERLAAPLPRAGGGRAQELGERVQALAEGLWLGSYRMPSYAREAAGEAPPQLQRVALLGAADEERRELAPALEAARATALAVYTARDLTNLPGNYLGPDDLARAAQSLAARYGLACTVLEEEGIREQGMGGLAAVGRGSVLPPRMIAVRYDGAPEKPDEVLGLVGKGITFDTGGISLKKPEGMEEMISDMGGAAVLLGLIHVLGVQKPAINVVIVIPAAENMPSAAAFKPGDVITLMNGQTVEVLNTDAEGRIVLADGVLYAKRLGATRLIDVATLTGAVLVSFADVATGAVSNNEALLQEVLDSARRANEKVWPLPNYPEYREMLKSRIADIKNSTNRDRWAGCITGGLFIGYFAGDTPWVHLDTGGTAWLWNERGTEPLGGTGAMVRTLGQLVCAKPGQQTGK